MNREELLTDLAEKLPEWPMSTMMPGPEFRGVWTNHGEWRCYAIGTKEPAITGEDWLRKKQELQWPVGSLCEVRRNDNDWLAVEVVAHDDGGIIYRDPTTTDHRYKWAIGGGIRPYRAPEQRAEDDAAQAMADVAYQSCGVECHVTYEGAAAIYTAIRDGKIPGVEIKRGDV